MKGYRIPWNRKAALVVLVLLLMVGGIFHNAIAQILVGPASNPTWFRLFGGVTYEAGQTASIANGGSVTVALPQACTFGQISVVVSALTQTLTQTLQISNTSALGFGITNPTANPAVVANWMAVCQ
jgi:hypothetical protein